MKKFVSAATTFITLSQGERLKDINMADLCQLYVIWPVDAKWRVRYKWLKGWEEIAEHDFNTDNAALTYAYEHLLKNDSLNKRPID